MPKCSGPISWTRGWSTPRGLPTEVGVRRLEERPRERVMAMRRASTKTDWAHLIFAAGGSELGFLKTKPTYQGTSYFLLAMDPFFKGGPRIKYDVPFSFLNQLSAFARGVLSASQPGGPLDTVSSPSTTESWSYDAVGNWSSVTLNSNTTNRTHNQQNEATAVGTHNLTFDKNGNTTTDDQGHTLIYDGWNRLVAVKSGSTTLEAYSYDGLGRRITENPGTLRDIYFSSAWQVVEEDVSGTMQDQYVWSPVYVDDLIERDTPTQRLYVQQDANWNVTALVNTSGSVVERYIYDPFGTVTYLNASWGTISGSAYGWVYLHQGGSLDTATGLYEFRNRDYSPTMGRWIENDPLGFAAGDANWYRYVGNQATDWTDPEGLTPTVDYLESPLPPFQ